jgi:hypothetical protein
LHRVGTGGFLLDRLQEVALLGVVAVVEQLSNVLTHTSCKRVSTQGVRFHKNSGETHTDGNLGHFDRLPVEFLL